MASSSSSSYHAPPSSFESWNHDVFISFRGEDTRKTFIDHLYTALVQRGIHTYKDDETLPRGELIGPALMKAIQESRIALIVFSRNYANSSWCLDELAYIMKCKGERGQIVIPIFYHVDPSQVRKQSGEFGEAFAKHELENNNKAESWRGALFDAGSLSGWVPTEVANGHESKFIKEIVDAIQKRLLPLYPNFDEDLVGLRTRLQRLKSKLEISLGGIRMVGIWGLGGGGKTTLASSLYYEIGSNFDGCCFVGNIREESSKHGLKELQAKILSAVLKQEKVNIGGVEEGRHMIKRRLCHKKVLIVLDDVDHVDQLEALAGSCNWFGEESRIIITTRDEHLLKAHKVNVIHDINLLDDKEAMELFGKHAPCNKMLIKDYEMLSKEVVFYAKGLPLALKVLGRFLCDKDTSEWRNALDRLRKIPNSDVVGKLKISYDGLDLKEKNLFLDIACFFRRTGKAEAMEIFDACGYYPTIGIKVLMQKALISVTDYEQFDMHDLVQEMAHYIVRGEHPDNVEKHSRVWDEKDIEKLCDMDETMALDNIEAIKVPSLEAHPLNLRNYHVANMKKLRWIHWQGAFESSLPENFQPRELRCLILEFGEQGHLWEDYMYLPYLRMIKLNGLRTLIKTPNFSGLPNLKRIILKGCQGLSEIHPSIGNLKELVYLEISDCRYLYTLPPITHSRNLETFILSNCSKVIKVSEIQQDKKTKSSKQVDLDKNRKEVASYEGSFTNSFVTYLTCCCSNLYADTEEDLNIDVECCLEEPPLPSNNILNLISLQIFHTNLKTLELSYCKLRDGDMDSAVWDMPNLKELDLHYNDFSRLNLGLFQLPRLKWLNVSYCKKLVDLAGLPSSIAVLIADYCYSLETVEDISNCKWLWKVLFGERNNVGPSCGDLILESMLQGNAIEHHFINFTTTSIGDITKGLVDRSVEISGTTTFRMKLPVNWCNDFSGFLIYTAQDYDYISCVRISITHEVDKQDSKDSHDSSEVSEPDCDNQIKDFEESNEARMSNRILLTNVGYVSFNSIIRDTTRLNSAYNTISISSDNYPCWCVAELVLRKSKGTTKIGTDSLEFFDKENTFAIQYHSNSSISILWCPPNSDPGHTNLFR